MGITCIHSLAMSTVYEAFCPSVKLLIDPALSSAKPSCSTPICTGETGLMTEGTPNLRDLSRNRGTKWYIGEIDN